MVVMAFFCLKIALFFAERPTPGILVTTLIVLPCAYIRDLELSKVQKAVRGQITWMAAKIVDRNSPVALIPIDPFSTFETQNP